VLDGAILARLLEIVRAVELLGARVLLAGVSAEVAQTIVENQLYVADLRSFSTLRDALESVLTNDMKFA
jgi:anti-anti-sigma regulatory factor